MSYYAKQGKLSMCPHPELSVRPHPELSMRLHPELSVRPHPELSVHPHPELSVRLHPELSVRPHPELSSVLKAVDEDARLCSATKECKMSLTIPLNSDLPNDRTAACVRLVPEEEEDGTDAFSPELAIPEADVSEDGSKAVCKVSRLGRYVV
eukprot:347386-Pelagomonas_calceolata.AAC.7